MADDTAKRDENGLVQERARDGILSVTLRARPEKVRVGDLLLDGTTYNGQYAGPVLRLHPGDLLRVRLINDLTQPTNLHFHGMRSSPLGNGDNAHLAIAPGKSFIYQLRVPQTQPPGLYWYHSHVHGISEHQVMGGLTGALVIDRPGPPSGLTERLFVLKDMTFDDDTGDSRIDDELHSLVQSVNGRMDVTEQGRPNQTQLWRFTNQSADRAFHLALEGHQFRVIAEDGETRVTPRLTDVLDIMPAARVDVLIDTGGPGHYALLSKGAMIGTGAKRRPDRVLGQLIVSGDAASPTPASALPPPPPDLTAAPIAQRRTVVFSETKTLNPARQIFQLNGKEFDATRVDFRVRLGDTEEWTIRNDSDDMHVFHIHQLGFQVMAVNGVAVPFDGRVDTVKVPERGTVVVRLPFTDPLIVGRFMFHCHILKHEDHGMMAQVEVYDPRPRGLAQRLNLLYAHVWWWWHGVPWAMCGIAEA